MPRVTPVYDRWGQHVAWMTGDLIYGLHGRAQLVLLREGCIASLTGRILGVLDRGMLRDLAGRAVAFLPEASGGPLLPVPRVPSPQPLFEVVSPMISTPMSSPVFTPAPGWSAISWEEFVEAGAPTARRSSEPTRPIPAPES